MTREEGTPAEAGTQEDRLVDPEGRGAVALDPNWLAHQPQEFHALIAREGREVYEFAFQTWQLGGALGSLAGVCQEALGQLAQESARTRRVAQALAPQAQAAGNVAVALVNILAGELREAKGISLEKLQEVQRDLERAAALARPGASGLVLAH